MERLLAHRGPAPARRQAVVPSDLGLSEYRSKEAAGTTDNREERASGWVTFATMMFGLGTFALIAAVVCASWVMD
jgi:hypothetical protein